MRKLTKKEKNIIQYIFLAFLIILTGYIVSTTIEIDRIPDVINFVDKKFIILGMLMVVMYILIETVVFQMIINSVEKNKRKKTIGLQMGTVGLYYNLVTPFASGSQPMQIYLMNRYGINLSKAVAIVTNKTVLFQSVVTVMCGLALIFNKELIHLRHGSIKTLLIMGMTMNLVSIIGGLLIVLNPSFMKKLSDVIINFLGRFRLFRFLRGKNDRAHHYINDFNKSILMYITDKKSLFITLVLTVLQLSVYFSISFFIYKASRLSGVGFIDIFVHQIILYMTVSPIPTPGNVGANELTFFSIFNGIFPRKYVGYAVIMYSFLVYYMILILSGICTFISHYYIGRMSLNKEGSDIKQGSKKETNKDGK